MNSRAVRISLVVFLALSVYQFVDPTAKGRVVLPGLPKFGVMQNPMDIQFQPIVRLANDKGVGFCSAWIIDSNYAITAAHCINSEGHLNTDDLKIFDGEGTDIGVVVKAVAYDMMSDLGLLKGDFHNVAPLRVNFNSDGFPRGIKGLEYITCGYPWGQKHITCTSFMPTNMMFFEVAGISHLIPGMSGGPVIVKVPGETGDLVFAVAVNTAVNEDKAIISPVQGILGLFGLE